MRHAMIALGALLMLAAAVSASHARDRTEEEQRRSLMSYLSAHEFVVSERVLEGIGKDVNRLLVHIASDPTVRPNVRGRAIAALRVYPSPRTKQYLESLLWERDLKGTSVGTLLRREALRTLGRAFGDEVVHVIAGLRESDEDQIREAVARGLGDTGSRHALQILEGWLHNEPELFVRLAIDESITALRRSQR